MVIYLHNVITSGINVVNPATGARVETYDEHDEGDVEEALGRSVRAFEDWWTRSVRDRFVAR